MIVKTLMSLIQKSKNRSEALEYITLRNATCVRLQFMRSCSVFSKWCWGCRILIFCKPLILKLCSVSIHLKIRRKLLS